MKHDMLAGRTETHDHGYGCMTLEPVFVRRSDAKTGTTVGSCRMSSRGNRNLTNIVILSAQNFVGDPEATIRLPVRVPFGFHGGRAPDSHFASIFK
jgi:carotenoid cleavage dioxygenase-like enzyme